MIRRQPEAGVTGSAAVSSIAEGMESGRVILAGSAGKVRGPGVRDPEGAGSVLRERVSREKGVTRRSTQPVQNNVLVERDAEGRLRLSATDLEFVEASAWEEGFDERDVRFRITLPPKALRGAVQGKPAKAEVEFRPSSKREADFAIAGAVTRIIGLPAEDHELLPAGGRRD